MSERRFYVYAYYLKSTGEIFHIGKGTGRRMYDRKTHRNEYFKNVINKYGDDVDVKILIDNLTEDEAWAKEKELIETYKKLGQCKTNLHEGGHGGYTGKYDDPVRSKKISDKLKGVYCGEKNPNYNHHWTDEQKAAMSVRVKALWQNEEFYKNQCEKYKGRTPWNKGLTKNTDARIKSPVNKGQKMSAETHEKMLEGMCKYLYQIYLEDKLIFEDIGFTKLVTFCHDELGISRTIIEQVIKGTWTPKFAKHQHLVTLKIIRIDRKCTD